MTVEELLERARSQVGLGIRYKMGGGTSKAARHTCADTKNTCDCSSFVCWALGIDKNGSYPYLRPPGNPPDPSGDWYGTDQIWEDAVRLRLGQFQQIDTPVPGCVIVFPTTWKSGKARPAGHCGIVSAVGRGQSLRVLHCSSGNFKAHGDAVQETNAGVFTDPRTVFAWCGQIDLPMVRGKVADLGLRDQAGAPATRARAAFGAVAAAGVAVRFIVVATGADETGIAQVAAAVASDNPIGRKVVRRGDPDFPSQAQITQLTAGVADPGAIVLRPNGTLFEVLDVEDAKNPAAVTEVFAFASEGA